MKKHKLYTIFGILEGFIRFTNVNFSDFESRLVVGTLLRRGFFECDI